MTDSVVAFLRAGVFVANNFKKSLMPNEKSRVFSYLNVRYWGVGGLCESILNATRFFALPKAIVVDASWYVAVISSF